MDIDTDNSLNQVLVDRALYIQLIKEHDMLDCLLSHGVDTWEGYSDAMESLEAIEMKWDNNEGTGGA